MTQHTLIKSTSEFKAKNYEHLIGMEGFSEKQLKTHFKLYEGYVTNTNMGLQTLESLVREGEEKTPPFAEIKRRLGWEYNGMRLHEYYFDNLGGEEPLSKGSPLYHAIQESFGSFENWKKDFLATGAMRGIGWCILYEDPITNRLTNFWIEEHNANHLAGGHPLIVMDVFEHAFMIDYGTERPKYIEAFFKNLDWNEAERRFQ